MDDLLPTTLFDFAVCSFMVVGGTTIVFVANPWVVLRSVFLRRKRPGCKKRVPPTNVENSPVTTYSVSVPRRTPLSELVDPHFASSKHIRCEFE